MIDLDLRLTVDLAEVSPEHEISSAQQIGSLQRMSNSQRGIHQAAVLPVQLQKVWHRREGASSWHAEERAPGTDGQRLRISIFWCFSRTASSGPDRTVLDGLVHLGTRERDWHPRQSPGVDMCSSPPAALCAVVPTQ